MNNYLLYAYNLKGQTKYEKVEPSAGNALLSYYMRRLESLNALEQRIADESDCDVLQYISEFLDLKLYYKSIVLTTSALSYTDGVDFNNFWAIINLRKVNNIQYPNKLFQAVNTLLPDAGIYIGRLETYTERKNTILRHMGPYLGQAFWMADFVLHRVIPRIPYLEDLYFYLTNGKFHAISQAEVLGRLVYCGFDIIDFKRINGLSYFVAMKTHKPVENVIPSYYPIIKLYRIGRFGKMIRVYKLRTMHPYSEYLQDYVIHLYGYNDKGKPAMDFRLTRWGKLFRKLWIDELPQLLNVLKFEMKLVGLRPLSLVRYSEFPEDLKRERIKYKPGCFPPYVALNMPNNKENILAERIYIEDLKKHPYTTDIRYLFKSIFNILTNRITSC